MSSDKKVIQDTLKNFDRAYKQLDAYGRKAYALDHKREETIQILPDESVSASNFKPHPEIAGAFLAHPLTIRAMKKDIFILGDDIEFTDIQCSSCSHHFEKQCWNLCPFCGADIP